MNPQPDHVTRVVSECIDAIRVVVFQHVTGDTFAFMEDGEVSLSNRDTLEQKIQQIVGG